MTRIYAELDGGNVNYFVYDDYDDGDDDAEAGMLPSLVHLHPHDDGDGDEYRDHHDDDHDNH